MFVQVAAGMVLHACIIVDCVMLRKLRTLTAWRPLVDDVINLSLRVAELVSPVVSHVSPEGNIPQDAIMGTAAGGFWHF